MQHGLKAKTIKAILRRKIDAWLASIDDEGLRKRCRNDAIVTGGCIASMLLGEEVNDFDVYFRTKATAKAVADYYVARFLAARTAPEGGVPVDVRVEELADTRGKDRVRIVVKSAGVAAANSDGRYQYFETLPDHEAGDYLSEVFDRTAELESFAASDTKDDYAPSFLSSNAISLRGKVQLILRFYGSPDEIHENYDFTHCTNYWECVTGSLTLRPEALEVLLARTLLYQGSLYPICSVIRTRKFIERGWRINAGQYLKMCLQVGDLDLTNPEMLEEQLTGVDAAYFAEVMSKLRDRDPARVDTAYLIEILDRMF